ncbi:MAG: sigma 54-interacting transcriptional regulator [Nitrospiraceae bacterium]
MPKTKLLIVEDYEGIVTLLRSTLEDEFELVVARDTAEGLNAFHEHKPHVVLLDLGLPPKSSPEEGLRFLRELKQVGGHHKTIVCTGYDERSLAVRAIGYGARDVLYKPLDLVLLKSILQRSGWIAELEMEAQQSAGTPAAADAFEQMIGTCPAMIRICDVVKRIARTEAQVLVTGENGTGKALTARAIHERSLRRTGPFVTVDCGILPEALLDAELFGSSRQGIPDGVIRSKLESARGGTLFLEDVCRLSPSLQAKLVRVLDEQVEEGEARRRPSGFNVRVLASTTANVNELVHAGRFREDLSRRLAAVRVHLPPLRERGEDVVLMAIIFLRQAAAQYQKRIHGLTKDAVEAIRAYPWPGNVQELASKVRRAVSVVDATQIGPEDLDIVKNDQPSEDTSISLKVNQQRIETDLIMKAFTLSHGNLSRAALELGISRSTLYRRIRQYGLDRDPDAMRVS